jgi:transcriptional regulator with XRE-family HTH domain
MGQPVSPERDSSIIVNLSEAAMHMYTAAIDALPFPEDKKFHARADVVLSGMRKLRAALTDAASTTRPSPAVIAALSDVRRRYDSLMAHAAAAPGSSLGQQIYVTRIEAKLSAHEVANGAGVRPELLDELEAGGTPTDDEAARIKETIDALGGVPGTEHLQPLAPETKPAPEPEKAQDQEQAEQSNATAWEDELVADNAG